MTHKKMRGGFSLPISHDYDLSEHDGTIIAYDMPRNEDAGAIALAVNNHDKLVEALEAMIDRVEYYDYGAEGMGKAKALLKAIKGDK